MTIAALLKAVNAIMPNLIGIQSQRKLLASKVFLQVSSLDAGSSPA
ncbi:hypothetical protein [Lampropedia hyalina]|nr:hypothetical protein [Lampropedia hyalina]